MQIKNRPTININEVFKVAIMPLAPTMDDGITLPNRWNTMPNSTPPVIAVMNEVRSSHDILLRDAIGSFQFTNI